jgi:hypothetical protein
MEENLLEVSSRSDSQISRPFVEPKFHFDALKSPQAISHVNVYHPTEFNAFILLENFETCMLIAVFKIAYLCTLQM